EPVRPAALHPIIPVAPFGLLPAVGPVLDARALALALREPGLPHEVAVGVPLPRDAVDPAGGVGELRLDAAVLAPLGPLALLPVAAVPAFGEFLPVLVPFRPQSLHAAAPPRARPHGLPVAVELRPRAVALVPGEAPPALDLARLAIGRPLALALASGVLAL